MNKHYEKLANELDRIPNGFPRTKSGVDLSCWPNSLAPGMLATLSMEPRSLGEIAEMNRIEEAWRRIRAASRKN